jgi:hypothetical protein
MRMRLWTPLFVVTVLTGLTLMSCSSGGGGPQAGSPAWYWQAAQETYASGDYEKAQQHLKEVADGESEYKEQATLWRASILGGLARGYMESGNALAEAMEEDESLTGTFTVKIQGLRRDARRHAISFTESIGGLRKIGDQQPNVALRFPFPKGSANESPTFQGLREGQKFAAAQIDEAISYTLQRGLLLQTAQMAGSGGDAAKAQSMFESGEVQVPKLVFLQNLGKSLYEISALFGSEQLHEPKIQKVMLDNALQCLAPALEAEDADLKQQAMLVKEEIDKESE